MHLLACAAGGVCPAEPRQSCRGSSRIFHSRRRARCRAPENSLNFRGRFRGTVAKLESARAFASDRALAVISDPTAAGPIRIHAVSSRQALSAVLQRYFDREFFARPFFPENFGPEIFEPLGFTREPLTQWLMRFEF